MRPPTHANQTLGVIQAVNKTSGRHTPAAVPPASAAAVGGSAAVAVGGDASAENAEYPVFSNEDAVLLRFIGVVAAGIYNNCVLLENAKR